MKLNRVLAWFRQDLGRPTNQPVDKVHNGNPALTDEIDEEGSESRHPVPQQ